jgi:8-oxo-dGTP pyrophosphatase MutT (NUDIX family)
MSNDYYCNNCGKEGHQYNQCKMPITSVGVIAYRYNLDNNIEYLMIRRKDTLGFIDFMRGKYSLQNKDYIMNMLKQMTTFEKNALKDKEFNDLWASIWGINKLSSQYKNEENISKNKFYSLRSGLFNKGTFYNLNDLINESCNHEEWLEPEWGFPKGRRNFQEKDFDCAMREFSEETGFSTKNIHNVQNIMPFEEIFTGSNYKSYKHKYFITHMNFDSSTITDKYEKTEVSKMEWKTIDSCLSTIRPYNLEKKIMLTKINNMLLQHAPVKFL